MNSLILALIIPTLPYVEPPYPENSTNVHVAVNMERLNTISFSIDISPSSSNEVAVAVGNDADGNGDLSFDEASVVFGYDNGERYFADLETGNVAEGVASTIVFKRGEWAAEWNLVKVIKRGVGNASESVEADVENKKFVIRLR